MIKGEEEHYSVSSLGKDWSALMLARTHGQSNSFVWNQLFLDGSTLQEDEQEVWKGGQSVIVGDSGACQQIPHQLTLPLPLLHSCQFSPDMLHAQRSILSTLRQSPRKASLQDVECRALAEVSSRMTPRASIYKKGMCAKCAKITPQ